jgi:hypothetical protein
MNFSPAVGAIVASTALKREVLKLLDCVAICAPRRGPPSWQTSGPCWLRPWRTVPAASSCSVSAASSARCVIRSPIAAYDVVREFVPHDVLVIPGTAFQPDDRGTFRVSVSNIDSAPIGDFIERVSTVGQDRASDQKLTPW